MGRIDRSEQMRRLLMRREQEHLTYREAAALEPGISVNQLMWWRRKLDGPAVSGATRMKRPAFVELVEPRQGAARVEIALRGERRLSIDASVDEALLMRLVRTLERC